MRGITLQISGRWAQFRKPETNNTPLTHDFITKTAFIGLLGAVLGIERTEMRAVFPLLSEDLLYGVQINGVVKKESWAFTMRNVHAPNDPTKKAPRQMEFLRDPSFTVALALRDERSADLFDRFASSIQKEESCYPPVLGLHNCPAELGRLEKGDFTARTGAYRSRGFVLRSHRSNEEIDFREFRIGFERIPTHQTSDWWNRPEDYREVIYPSNGKEIAVTGDHYRFSTGDDWCLI